MNSRRLRNGITGLLGAALLSPGPARAAEAAWVRLGLETTAVWSIAVDPLSPSSFYAAGHVGALSSPVSAEARLARSLDAGATWSGLDLRCRTTYTRFVTTGAGLAGTLYAGSGADPCPLFVSRDAGRTWLPLPPPGGPYYRPSIDILVADPTWPATLYAGGNNYGCEAPGCLYRSTDGGESWAALDLGALDTRGNYPDILSIAVDPTVSGTLYVGTKGLGGFKTTDSGATWRRFDPVDSVTALAVDSRDPERVYAAGDGKVFSSADGGATWSSSTGDPFTAVSFAVDARTSPSTVYAGGTEGVYRSQDGGRSFTRLERGDAPRQVTSLAVASTNPPALLAGSSDRGVYALGLGEAPSTWLVPSAARAPGAGGALYTTDLAIANPGTADASFSIQFLGHDVDGTEGPVSRRALAGGHSVTYADVLGSLFGIDVDYGALRITSDSSQLRISALTSTPPPDGRGRVGQSVPAFDAARLASPGRPAVLVGLRDDASSRTNLLLSNASDSPVSVTIHLVDALGSALGSAERSLPPLGMTQVRSVVARLGGADRGDVYLVVVVSTPGGAVAACATVVDNVTNDPSAVLP